MLRVFSYWKAENNRLNIDFQTSWTRAFPGFAIYGEAETAEEMRRTFPEYHDLFMSLRLPAAQSDICRLLMLYLHGGLYVDCHFGYDDETRLQAFVEDNRHLKLVVVDNAIQRAERPAHFTLLINGFLLAQPRHPAILAALHTSFQNLAGHRAAEREAFTPYSIWRLCGPLVLNKVLFDVETGVPTRGFAGVKSEYAEGLRIVREIDLPAKRNVYKSYTSSGMHWSERQLKEPLFRS